MTLEEKIKLILEGKDPKELDNHTNSYSLTAIFSSEQYSITNLVFISL
jgi:hypothetical protein